MKVEDPKPDGRAIGICIFFGTLGAGWKAVINELYLFGPPVYIIGAVFLDAVVSIMAYLLPAPMLFPKDIDI